VPNAQAATVLVIDDEPSVRTFFARALEISGLVAVQAASSEAALSLLDEGLRPDAVLLDINMPGMGGLGFLLRLRATPRYARLPVAIVTAQTSMLPSVQTVAQLMRVPVYQKPLDIDAIARLTDRLLHGSAVDPDASKPH
jgi:CheY-like chemotaxis protein